MKLANPEELPDDVRTGVGTSGPRKKGDGRWEYVMLVAINDLGDVARVGAQASGGGLVTQIIGRLRFGNIEETKRVDDCPDQFGKTEKEWEEFLKWWETNEYETPDKKVAQYAVEDSKAYC